MDALDHLQLWQHVICLRLPGGFPKPSRNRYNAPRGTKNKASTSHRRGWKWSKGTVTSPLLGERWKPSEGPLHLTLTFGPLFSLPLSKLHFSLWLSGPGHLLFCHADWLLPPGPPQSGSGFLLTSFPRAQSFRTPAWSFNYSFVSVMMALTLYPPLTACSMRPEPRLLCCLQCGQRLLARCWLHHPFHTYLLNKQQACQHKWSEFRYILLNLNFSLGL